LFRAFFNSTVLTLGSIAILVLLCAMAGYVLQRRTDRATPVFNFLILAGLIIPPAIVPTIWVLDGLHLFKTLFGLILVEVALGFSFAVLLYKGFMATIPREIDEAAVMDGCGGFRLFFRMILPLLQPVTATVIVLSSVSIFNDFTNPLYFLPGANNVTVQLTLYNFQSQFVTQYNLLFTNILLITIPPLLLFLFFNKRIVAGMTAGSVKG
jgi:raffinose/stachyose/melibiose transport system permease protein